MKVGEIDSFNKVALGISGIVALFLISIGFVTSDMTHHLFFAEHYAQNWFSLYEHQIGGGLNMGTYPPLTYQILAFLSFFLPIQAGYWILNVISWMALSYFATKLFSDYLSMDKDAEWFMYVLIFSSIGILKTIFVHGQITTMVGLAFGFMALFFLREAIISKKKSEFLLFALSYALVGMSHHFSFLLVSLAIPFILADNMDLIFEKEFVQRFMPSIIFTTFIISLGIWPFVANLLFGGTPTQEIAHFTRQSVFGMSAKQVKSTVYLVYGLGGILFPFPLLAQGLGLDKLRNYLKLYLVAVFFLILGLGPTTPLPEIVLYGIHHWVTYDRFALFSSIIFTGILAAVTYSLVNSSFRDYRNHILVLLAGIFVVLNVALVPEAHHLAHGDPVDTPNEHREEMTSYMVDFLDDKSSDYRYQTFGYGVPISQLYLQTDKPTLDTWYFSGIQKEWLRNSGVGDIDSADETFIANFMNRSTEESVKYIFTIDPTYGPNYHNVIGDYNWEKKSVKQFGERKLIVWENPEELEPLKTPKEDKSILNYSWGTVPMTVFLAWLICLYRLEIRKD